LIKTDKKETEKSQTSISYVFGNICGKTSVSQVLGSDVLRKI